MQTVPLAAAAAPEHRRHLTILFTDLSDSTRLSAVMEAEVYAEMLSEVRQAFRDVVTAHAGTINQFQGDGLQALFGYPQASEHDGRRATEAALEVHRRVRALRPKYAPYGVAELSVHSGIHAGSMLSRQGDDVAGRVELFGPGPGIAKHLSDEAAADEILVSEETLGPGSQFFETSERRRVLLKGRADALPIHRILARTTLRTRFEAHTQRGLVPFIGRRREMASLERALESVVGGRPRFLALWAAPGVGKTRLADEFLRRAAASHCDVWRGYCESDLSAEPLQPFLQMVRSRLCLPAGAPAAADEVAQALERIDPALTTHLAEFLRLLSVADDAGSTAPRRPAGEQTVAALRHLFATLARKSPQVVFIDDWQWADDATRQVTYALRQLEHVPLLLLVATRPLEPGDAQLSAAELVLPDLFSDAEADATIGGLLPGADPFVAAEVRRYAGGNPLFLEELCHFAASVGPHTGFEAVHGGSAWLETLIESRVARLASAEVELLRAAAVIGNVVPTWLLESLTGCGEHHPLVRDLAEHDFVFPGERGATLRFKHGITRDVVYGNVGLAQRRAMHASIARLIRERAQPAGESDACEALAYHHAGAAAYEEAARFAAMAGDKATAASSLDRAKAQYRAALDMLDRLPAAPQRYQAWRSIVRRLGMASVFDPARGEVELFERAVARAREQGDAAGQAYAEYWLAYIHYALGDLRRSIGHCEVALQSALALNDEALAVQARATLGQALAAGGNYLAALDLLDDAARIQRTARPPGRPSPGVAYSLACKASAFGDLGRFDEADVCFAEALAAVPGMGHEVTGSVLCLRSGTKLWQGRWEEARVDALAALRVAERVKSFYLFAMSRGLGAYASWQLDADPQALRELADAASWLEARDKHLFISLHHGWLADALSALDRPADARRHAAQALARTRQRDWLGAAMAARAMARLAAGAGHADEARRHLDVAQRAARMRDSAHEAACNELCRAQIEHASGAPGQALVFAERAAIAFESMQMHWHLSQVARLRLACTAR